MIISAVMGKEAILGKNCVLQGPEPRASLYPMSYFMQTCKRWDGTLRPAKAAHEL